MWVRIPRVWERLGEIAKRNCSSLLGSTKNQNKDVSETSLREEKGFCGKLTLCGEPSGVGVAYKTTN